MGPDWSNAEVSTYRFHWRIESIRSAIDQPLLSVLLLILRIQAFLSVTEVDLAAVDPCSHRWVGDIERIAIAEEKCGAVSLFERTKSITDADDLGRSPRNRMQCRIVRKPVSSGSGRLMGQPSFMSGLIFGRDRKRNSRLMKRRCDDEWPIDRMVSGGR